MKTAESLPPNKYYFVQNHHLRKKYHLFHRVHILKHILNFIFTYHKANKKKKKGFHNGQSTSFGRNLIKQIKKIFDQAENIIILI